MASLCRGVAMNDTRPAPLALSDLQLECVLEAAATVPLGWRDRFLQNLADRLTGYEITDERVNGAIAAVLGRIAA